MTILLLQPLLLPLDRFIEHLLCVRYCSKCSYFGESIQLPYEALLFLHFTDEKLRHKGGEDLAQGKSWQRNPEPRRYCARYQRLCRGF